MIAAILILLLNCLAFLAGLAMFTVPRRVVERVAHAVNHDGVLRASDVEVRIVGAAFMLFGGIVVVMFAVAL